MFFFDQIDFVRHDELSYLHYADCQRIRHLYFAYDIVDLIANNCFDHLDDNYRMSDSYYLMDDDDYRGFENPLNEMKKIKRCE